MGQLKRVLIANRGEIAVRIIRTLSEMGLESVAVYSDADADSLHRKLATYAVHLPGRASSETYLDIAALKKAAAISGADAVHPGYGFLSENSDFCREMIDAGLVFIGPHFESMNTMGNKVSAKKLMIEHEVPTVPGSDGALASAEELKTLVDRIGYPIILKAAAGGGGRGMRIVRADSELTEAFETCAREAQSYFGNPMVFAERLLENPRHIEIQVLCDGTRGVHLFERDCSIQRRHQKLIEEAPSMYLTSDQRAQLGEFAVKAALAVGYTGVGTVEFICEAPDKAYFMEMNTRIQVEHPVTEMITGIDLVREQINVASGEQLTMTQDDIKLEGWAFEARINAEDASQDFMPNPDTITRLHLPAGPFIRVDTHIYPDYKIPADYDSMIAKIICWGPTRDIALARLKRALGELEIGGVVTTARFHEAIVDHQDFRTGEFDTSFIAEKLAELLETMASHDAERRPAAAALAATLIQRPQLAATRQMTHSGRPQWTAQSRVDSQQN